MRSKDWREEGELKSQTDSKRRAGWDEKRCVDGEDGLKSQIENAGEEWIRRGGCSCRRRIEIAD